MHRNTAALTAILAGLAVMVIVINLKNAISPQAPPPVTPTPTVELLTPTEAPLITYDDTECGVTLAYPPQLEITESTTSGTIFSDPEHPQDTIILACQYDIPRVPLAEERIEELTIPGRDGVSSASANLYHDASPKDGTPIDKLIFTHPVNDMDIYVAGIGEVYDRMIKSLVSTD